MEGSTYDLGGGWKVRWYADEMPEMLELFRHTRRVYGTIIPPKMNEEALLDLALSLAQVYDTAWAAGWEECRRVIIAAAEEATETLEGGGGE